MIPLLMALCLSACLESDSDSITGSWTVPQSEILDGGPGKDGIPAINTPQFFANPSDTLLADAELIVAFRLGGDIRAYTHQVLDYHEIINDKFNDVDVSISYCPLTGSSMVWQGKSDASLGTSVDRTDKSFGVSGLLYNSNLILYDRATDSNWSQMLMRSINGKRAKKIATQLASSEMSWGAWKKLYPDKPVLNFNTGFSRPYGRYPYGNYKFSNSTIFPVHNKTDERFTPKQRVLGVKVLESIKAFAISDFSNDGITVLAQTIGGDAISIWGSNNLNFAVAFNNKLNDGTVLTFTALTQSDFPALVSDNEGNHWDVFGVALSGPRAGQTLNKPFSFIAYWFAWTAFYPNGEVYEGVH